MAESRLFYAMTARLIRDKAQPHLSGAWISQALEIRGLPEVRR